MTDKDRNQAAVQENSAANLANLDVKAAPVPDPDSQDDLRGTTTDGEDDTPQPDRSTREPQE